MRGTPLGESTFWTIPISENQEGTLQLNLAGPALPPSSFLPSKNTACFEQRGGVRIEGKVSGLCPEAGFLSSHNVTK